MTSTLKHVKGLLPLDYVDRLVANILYGSEQGGTGTTEEERQTRLLYTMQFPVDDVNTEDIRIIVQKLREGGLFISESDVNEYKRLIRGRNGGRKVRRKRKSKRKRR